MTQTALIGQVGAPELHVMSFNIRRRMPHLTRQSPDDWSHRQWLVKQVLHVERPTLLGVQEALPEQVARVAASLGAGYRSIGRGRNADGSGEQCDLFYDAGRLQLIDWNQAALSDRHRAPGSTSWGNRVPRIVVSGTFRDRVTGTVFLAANTHFDHLSATSRRRSARFVRNLVARSGRPAVVMGDFNADVGGAAFLELTEGGRLRDTWAAAQTRVTEEWGTFPHYRDPVRGAKRIDWILVTREAEVLRAAINVTTYAGAWPSDHAPVQAEIRFAPDARRNG